MFVAAAAYVDENSNERGICRKIDFKKKKEKFVKIERFFLLLKHFFATNL